MPAVSMGPRGAPLRGAASSGHSAGSLLLVPAGREWVTLGARRPESGPALRAHPAHVWRWRCPMGEEGLNRWAPAPKGLLLSRTGGPAVGAHPQLRRRGMRARLPGARCGGMGRLLRHSGHLCLLCCQSRDSDPGPRGRRPAATHRQARLPLLLALRADALLLRAFCPPLLLRGGRKAAVTRDGPQPPERARRPSPRPLSARRPRPRRGTKLASPHAAVAPTASRRECERGLAPACLPLQAAARTLGPGQARPGAAGGGREEVGTSRQRPRFPPQPGSPRGAAPREPFPLVAPTSRPYPPILPQGGGICVDSTSLVTGVRLPMRTWRRNQSRALLGEAAPRFPVPSPPGRLHPRPRAGEWPSTCGPETLRGKETCPSSYSWLPGNQPYLRPQSCWSLLTEACRSYWLYPLVYCSLLELCFPQIQRVLPKSGQEKAV